MTTYVNGINVEVFKPIWEKVKERLQTVKKARNQLRRDVNGECHMCIMGLILDTAGVGTWTTRGEQQSAIAPAITFTDYQFDLKPSLVEELAATDPFYNECPYLFASIPSTVCAAVGLSAYTAQNFTAWNDVSVVDDWNSIVKHIETSIAGAESRRCS